MSQIAQLVRGRGPGRPAIYCVTLGNLTSLSLDFPICEVRMTSLIHDTVERIEWDQACEMCNTVGYRAKRKPVVAVVGGSHG